MNSPSALQAAVSRPALAAAPTCRRVMFSLLVTLASGMAQAVEPALVPAEAFSARLQVQLGLDDAQRAEIRDTLAMTDATPSLDSARTRAALALVLTGEQLARLVPVRAQVVAAPTLSSL